MNQLKCFKKKTNLYLIRFEEIPQNLDNNAFYYNPEGHYWSAGGATNIGDEQKVWTKKDFEE